MVVPRLLASAKTSFGVPLSRDERTPRDVWGRLLVYMIRTRTKFGSFYLSGKLPTYSSPKATLILTSHLR